MPRQRVDSAVTLPEAERLGGKLARLQPKHASYEQGVGGNTPAWIREDPQTVAAAIGAYTQGRPKRKFPSLLVMLRYWPEGVRPEAYRSIVAITNGILCHRFEPAWSTMPSKVRDRLELMLGFDDLAEMLVEEFRVPSPCWKCKGHGKVRTGLDEDNKLAPIIVDCPQCRGLAEAPRSMRSRASKADLTTYHWKNHANPVYERTLHGFRFMADSAVSGILKRLG